METSDEVLHLVNDLTTSAWALAALSAALESGLLDPLTEPRSIAYLHENTGIHEWLVEGILDVTVALGLVYRNGDVFRSGQGLIPFLNPGDKNWLLAKLRSAQLQSQSLVRNATQGNLVLGWQHTDPELLQAQGRLGSDEMVNMFAHLIMPHLSDLAERFAASPVYFLDIGAGVGALSIAMARRWPNLRVVAIEPSLAPLAEAQQNILNAALEDRIELRKQSIEEITEEGVFDLVWLPQMFISSEDLSRGLAPVRRALRPGGWVWLPALNDTGPKLRYTVNRLRNILWGGSPIHCDQLIHLLVEAGFDSVRPMANKPTGEHRFVVGRHSS